MIAVMEVLARNVKEGLPWELLYADDLVLIVESMDGLKEKMNKWKECMETKGLKVNIGKTKVMARGKACGEVERTGKWPCAVCKKGVLVNSIQCTMCTEWVHQKCSGLRGSLTSVAATFKCKVCTEGAADGGNVELDLEDCVKLEGVKTFCDLGDMLNGEGGSDSATVARVRCAWKKLWELSGMLTRRGVSLKLKGKARIAFLQGERKGQENLKKDLVRRIKMLEYALKQERAKYHKLKYGTELNQGDMKAPAFDMEEMNDTESPALAPNSQLTWRQGRQLLRQYLQEVGYTDTILDVRSQRVRALLGLSGPEQNGAQDAKNIEQLLNGRDILSINSKEHDSKRNGDKSRQESMAVLEKFDFLRPDASDEEDEPFGVGHNSSKKPKMGNEGLAADLADDLETEAALKEFDFLGATEDGEGAGEARSSGDEKEDLSPPAESWEVDQGLISKLKEQYKKERKVKKGVKRPNRSTLQDMLANLREVDDFSPLQPGPVSPPRQVEEHSIEHDGGRPDDTDGMSFSSDAGKLFMPGTGKSLDPGLGLGELADLTVTNDADSPSYDIATNKDAFRKTWNPKFTLRSHFDSVHALAFHPIEQVLITASEDHTLKLWNLQKTTSAKKTASLDVEPIYTFRAHTGPVLSLTISTTGEQCFSGGTDATIRCWNIPNPNIDPYDTFDASVLGKPLVGHTDSTWDLAYSSLRRRLLSCSADGTVRLWDPTDASPCLSIFNSEKEHGTPTSVDFVGSDATHLVASFCSGDTVVYDTETLQPVVILESKSSSDAPLANQINSVASHPTLPITVTAHEDRHIKFFDNNTGKQIHAMVAHLDAVTCLAVDPNGLYLMSGSHDCSIRLWNLESKTCVQEITAHRKKFDEAIHDVAFHPSKAFIASAGADALAKVFV
uniref:striatin-3 isoform X2 n=1 Tax=Myxine glutinosa TaxID=7769 RepID=UPI00358F83B0